MGYAENNLAKGEKLEYQAQLHMAKFIFPGLWAAMLLLGALGMLAGGDRKEAGWSLAIGFVLLAWTFLVYCTTEFVVTNKRVIGKVGIIRRQSVELLLSKVESIAVKQGILGRMMGFGTIVITGTGGSKASFNHIANPMALRRAVQDRI